MEAIVKGLTEGRIVHYVLDSGRSQGQHRPAIVVRAWRGEAPHDDLVQLQVFTDQTNDGFDTGIIWRTSVHFDDQDKAPGSWHWIEQA